MATHSSILAWESPWALEPGGLQFMGSQGVGHNLATKQQQPGELGASFFWPRSPWILSLSREINLAWLTGSLLILWTLQCLWEQENRLSHSHSDLREAIHTQKPDKMVILQQTSLNKKRRLVRDAHLGEWGRGRSSSLLFTKPSALTWVWMQSGPSGLHGHRGNVCSQLRLLDVFWWKGCIHQRRVMPLPICKYLQPTFRIE